MCQNCLGEQHQEDLGQILPMMVSELSRPNEARDGSPESQQGSWTCSAPNPLPRNSSSIVNSILSQ